MLPPQHGAWAMLAVPYLAGVISAGFRWPDVPLLGAAIGGYLLTYYVQQAVKSRRWSRYRVQLLLYAAITAPLAAVVVAARPPVLFYAPSYGFLIAVNVWYARRRDERALLNDATSVLLSCLMVFVVGTVAGARPGALVEVFALCLMYFLGTVLYVKTMIRERGSRAYRRWSIGAHAAAVLIAAAISVWAVVLFAWLLVRAAVLPGRGLNPKRVGLVEIINSLLLLACVLAL